MADGVSDATQDDDAGADGTVLPLAVAQVVEVAEATVRLARWAVPGASSAAVVVGRDGQVARHSDDVARRLQQLERELGQGPSTQVLVEGATVHAPDLAADGAWPAFAAAALDVGVHGLVAVPVRAARGVVGSLVVVGTAAGDVTEESRRVTELLATHLSAATAAAGQVRQLETALASRDLIGQAKGILMERHGLDAERAFDVLVRYSRSGNTKLREIAELLVSTRALPEEPPTA